MSLWGAPYPPHSNAPISHPKHRKKHTSRNRIESHRIWHVHRFFTHRLSALPPRNNNQRFSNPLFSLSSTTLLSNPPPPIIIDLDIADSRLSYIYIYCIAFGWHAKAKHRPLFFWHYGFAAPPHIYLSVSHISNSFDVIITNPSAFFFFSFFLRISIFLVEGDCFLYPILIFPSKRMSRSFFDRTNISEMILARNRVGDRVVVWGWSRDWVRHRTTHPVLHTRRSYRLWIWISVLGLRASDWRYRDLCGDEEDIAICLGRLCR